jgi:hypothetical protein
MGNWGILKSNSQDADGNEQIANTKTITGVSNYQFTQLPNPPSFIHLPES